MCSIEKYKQEDRIDIVSILGDENAYLGSSSVSAGAGGRSASPASAGSLAGPGPGTTALELATARVPRGWHH